MKGTTRVQRRSGNIRYQEPAYTLQDPAVLGSGCQKVFKKQKRSLMTGEEFRK